MTLYILKYNFSRKDLTINIDTVIGRVLHALLILFNDFNLLYVFIIFSNIKQIL